ncbi:FUSC family protein [Agrobacterium cavarae]|uniref:FUSC family protein n=1 Tax=Agrobacterium cavarae TaxID=2528239 RepID=A0ABY1Y2H8_9HYPH|nr:FUSC family protein [Agrobacterium cavarae]TBN08311.1 FUSC family protein [Agrobacterium cavarae]
MADAEQQRRRANIRFKGRWALPHLRRAARRLELRAVGLLPEQFSGEEGARAALAVGAPLIIALTTGQPALGWAVFAAFWTCLCDGPGPHAMRRRTLGLFVLIGTVLAFAGSWGASAGMEAALAVGPALVFVAILAGAAFSLDSLLGTLLAVVAVVAVGFPHPTPAAAAQSLTFLAGGSWAFLLINLVWRIDPRASLDRNAGAVIARLFDMAADLASIGDRGHRDAQWHSEHAEHRRAVRMSMERLRTVLARHPADARRYHNALRATEIIFGALVALDHAYIHRLGPTIERAATARAFATALLGVRLSLRGDVSQKDLLRRGIERLDRTAEHLTDDLMIGCVLALKNALRVLENPEQSNEALAAPPHQIAPNWKDRMRGALRLGLRQAAGVIGVYYIAIIFQLGYPYWATMALIVCLQGGARVTWARSLERIFGSLLGGFLALALLSVTQHPVILCVLAILLASVTISLRVVNYSIFVVVLTMLFIIVTDMMHPGSGVAAARVVDNLLGSIAALLAVLVLWPDFGPPLHTLIVKGQEANRSYLESVTAGRPVLDVRTAQRAAGLASIDVEVALHDLSGLRYRRNRLNENDQSALREMRNLAGEAAAAWHRRLAKDHVT